MRLIVTVLLSLLVMPTFANDQVKKTLEKNIPGVKFDLVKETPIPGLYEAVAQGQIIYITADGRYMIQGDLLDRVDNVSLTEATRTTLRMKAFQHIKEDQTIVFAPKEKAKHTITIFTDTTCGYCRKLHQEVPELNEMGVKVRYMLFPRAGLNSASYKALQSIWCADNQQEAMTTVKSGGSIPDKVCDNPIAAHHSVGQAVGLRGTPLIVTGDGSAINGYRPAAQLVQMLNAKAKK